MNKTILKQLRKLFRESVFERDFHKCKTCGRCEKLDAHHITDRHELPNGGYVKSNGVSLCKKCHVKAELYHQTSGQKWESGFHPKDLYNLIGSSYDTAYKDSEKLI
jgi:5-methylcytosine-specific restriction endonuclease McrA